MRKVLLISSILLLSLLNTGAVLTSQKKDTQGKPRPAVTFEEIRRVVLEIRDKAEAARASGNELTELDALRAMETEYAAKGQAAHQAIATLLLTLNPVVGNYREALRYADVGQEKPSLKQPIRKDPFKGYRPVDALDAIARVADAAQ